MTIRCLASGRIQKINLHENKRVHKGDVLFVITSESLIEQAKYYREKINQKELFIRDIRVAQSIYVDTSETIENSPTEITSVFNTSFYEQSFFRFLQKISEAKTHYNKAKHDYDRFHKLYLEKVIAPAEFEEYEYELQKSKDVISQITETQRSQWYQELKTLLEEKKELESQLTLNQKENSDLIFRAPVSGTVQNLVGAYPGSQVLINQELGQISPDTSLLVIAYVHPNDIGLVQKNMMVRLQVDAFNYNHWGMISGKVLDISHDIKFIENKPVFEVRCIPDKTFLKLRSGYKGFLKKGMTLHAHFIVTQRSLWQLLYDKVDSWVNPNL
jgi:HlyD family secretion protein